MLNSGTDSIAIFGVMADGSLSDLGEISSLPDGRLDSPPTERLPQRRSRPPG